MDFIINYDIKYKKELNKEKYPAHRILEYKCPVKIWNKKGKRIFIDDKELLKIYEQIWNSCNTFNYTINSTYFRIDYRHWPNIMIKKKIIQIKQKFSNADNVIDLSVDIFLLIFDVLTTPLLIPIRIAKYYIKGLIKAFIKRFLKKTYHRIYDWNYKLDSKFNCNYFYMVIWE